VPQHIYLSDDTIAANIAFGVASNNINHEAIEKASKISNLHKFIVNELPQKYETIVGERGIRLSGGQRQRIGIARALYHNPKILILDEATSSLDDKTEQGVMEAVNNLGKDITIIMIAHRLSTMRKCDTIFKINEGKLSDQGVYNDLF
jgi:ABC-type multidrug transport system fused ATPase/permease subunit